MVLNFLFLNFCWLAVMRKSIQTISYPSKEDNEKLPSVNVDITYFHVLGTVFFFSYHAPSLFCFIVVMQEGLLVNGIEFLLHRS